MKISKSLSAGIAAFALVAFAPAQAAVVNGDFENGLTGWVQSPNTEIAVYQGADYIPCCGVTGTPADLANHFASFGAGDQPNVSSIHQALAGITGGTMYALNFDFGALGGGFQTLTANIYDGEALIATGNYTASANNNLHTTFVNHSLSFTPTDSNVYVFFNVDPFTTSVDGILDNVVLTSAVPEPASWALMLTGFGFAGVALRRRRATKVQFA